MQDVVGRDRLRVGAAVVHLTSPVAQALGRYLRWRQDVYAGPSGYLLVSRQSRLHDLPVSADWLINDLLDGIAVHTLRQSAIHQLVRALGCDGLQLAAYTRLSLTAVGDYIKAFDQPLQRDHS